MGYSTSYDTVDKMMHLLEPVCKGENTAWQLDTIRQANKFAYKLREALHAAQHHKDRYPDLQGAHDEYVVHVIGTRVAAIRHESVVSKAKAVEVPAIPKKGQGGVSTSPTESPEEAEGPTRDDTIRGAQTVMTIIDAWISAPSTIRSLNFPEAIFGYQKLVQLYRWADKRDLIFFYADPGLTLQHKQEDLVEYAWSPDLT